jgi:hypothetical protein
VKCIATILFLLCTQHLHSQNFLFWVYNVNHHYANPPKTQEEWSNIIDTDGLSNASFFKYNFTLIPPYSTIDTLYNSSNPKKWNFVAKDYSGNYILSNSTVYYNTNFIISGCPVLMQDGIDASNNDIYKCTNKKFVKTPYRRTLLGKTCDNKLFIFSGTGSLFAIRKKLKEKISNIDWLINLDGGGSVFSSLHGLPLIRSQRKIPSILSYNVYKLEVIK